ncbi:RNase HII [Maritalea mobilis]|uniref:Ribonuclease HII n=2 Tax=Maritalea mobilis TaxID=483324 RepID=A0A4V3DAV3_9HYPH|nr:RNase HII [Maritalea mobilis]
MSLEESFHAQGKIVCGVDEAGRGPLAGPVVTAAVILNSANVPIGLNDSKKLTEKARDRLYDEIFQSGAFVGIASAPPEMIAAHNIRGATLLAMRRAVEALAQSPDVALIDGRDVPPNLPCAGHSLIKGDSRSLSIAAASIIAKVTRDRACEIMERDAPHFGFLKHKGYGTKQHLTALLDHGACDHHRKDFKPIAEIVAKEK